MDNLQSVLCAVGGFAFGTLAAYANSRVSKKGIKNSTVLAVMGTNAVRMIIDIAALVIAFLAVRIFNLPLMVTIISVALGLTIFGMIFLKRLTKQLMEEEERSKDGGE